MPHHRALAAPPARSAAPSYPELVAHHDAIYDLLLDGRLAREASPLLDFGSGDGATLGAITAGTPLRAVALDPRPPPRWNGPPETQRARGDALRLPFADDSFASGLLVDAFEWLREPAAALQEAARVVRGPIVVVQTDWPALWFDSEDPDLARELVRRWSEGAVEPLRARLAEEVERAGLTVGELRSVTIRAQSLEVGSLAAEQLRAIRRWLVVERPQTRASRFDRWRRELDRRAAAGHFEMVVRRYVLVVRRGASFPP